MDPRTGELAVIVDDRDREEKVRQLLKAFRTEAEAQEAGFVPLGKELSRDADKMIKGGKSIVPLSRPENRHECRLMKKRRRPLAKRRK
jgi:hypothetical protein